MKNERKNPMQRSAKTANGQFTLALHRDPSPPLDEATQEELLKALADLMLEALGGESVENQGGKEGSDESQDHA
jgi:hypothetical protein